MKSVLWGAVVAWVVIGTVWGEGNPGQPGEAKERKPQPAEVQTVGERGPHWQTMTNLVPVPDDTDGWSYQTNTYVHLEPGLNYQKANGDWVEAKEVFELLPEGAVARQGQHQVTLPANLNGSQSVSLVQPDGQVLTSRPHGLAYYDTATGDAVLRAEIKDCQGYQIAPNQILYTDAFPGEHSFPGEPLAQMHVLDDLSFSPIAVPEPSTYALFGLGLVALWWQCQRKATCKCVAKTVASHAVLLKSVALSNPYFTDTAASGANLTYQVRATKLQTTGSGSFWNLSQGTFITAP